MIYFNYISSKKNFKHNKIKVRRSEIVGKRIFEINEKYYFEDLGLRHTLVGYRQTDISKILENLVFICLKRTGYDIIIKYALEKID